MKGQNKIELNQAQMQEIVAFYLREKMFSVEFMENVSVSNVEQNGSSYSKQWVVTLEELPPPPAEVPF